ncbi:phage tail protein [Lactiplantibacillus plantarum]|uniref:phage tail protein n=1 Tax=Lactiplantibacillus plantarum TaxID=1590 RepID=UPI00358DEF5D
MAESNPTQVILTDDGLKIIKAQNTADNATSGITNLNDPNLMSVIEKQYNIAHFAGLTSQYNVIIQGARDDGIDTTALTTAYNNLNNFMASVLTDPDHASDVDRVTYKKYQDAYNEELAKIQNALQNNANNKLTSAANAASQAAIATSQAFSAADSASKEAQSISNQVDSSMSVQSQATVKAQSAADSAFNQAKKAIDDGKVTSQTVTDLKDGSTLTIAQLVNGLADKISNSEFGSYKYQTASQIGELVTDGAFSEYSQATARLISATVATSDFDSYKDQTARDISSKVESKAFESYQKQISDAFENTVSSADYKSDKKQTANMISDTVSDAIDGLTISNRNLALGTATAFKMTGNNTEDQGQVGYGFSKTIQKGTVVTVAFDVSSTTGVGSFLVQFNGADSGSNWQGMGTGNLVNGTKHISTTFTTEANQLHAFFRLDYATGDIAFSNFIISESSKEVSWTPAPEDQATQSQFAQLKDNIDLRVTKKGLISEINMQAGNVLISTSGQLTLSGKNINFDTANPVTIPSANIDKLLVDKQLKAADIDANTFSTNNGTFTVKQDGSVTAKNMTLIGGTLTSPTINASTINGSTINGTTFNAGDVINDSNNTAKYYPMTITSDGAYKSTYFDSAVGLQSSVESGVISYKYRSMIGNGAYSYDNVDINGQGITLDSGTTTTKDTNFSAAETETAYISLTTEAGLYLHGSNANIDFGGHLNDDSTSVGMYMNPYGNLIAKSASQYWQISVAGSDNTGGGVVARFGIDNASAYNIEFNRELDIGNFQINTGHTFTSADGDAIHFAKGRGGANDIYAGDVHYNSLVKSSLLSVKKDVKKANTAYWAQLVNSIDLATYQYKSDDNTSHLRLSSIVDDVNDTKQWQLPDVFVSRDEDGKLCGVDDSVLLNATLATVQEQQKEIDQLNGHNMELEARLNKLEAKLNG